MVESGSLSASSVLANYPLYPLSPPVFAEEWIISPATLISFLVSSFNGSAVDVYAVQFILIVAFEGFTFYLYANRLLRDCTGDQTTSIYFAAFLGGFVYMNQPVFNLEMIYWNQLAQTYAALPLLMLLSYLLIKTTQVRKAVILFVCLSLVISYLIVYDTHSLVIVPIVLIIQLLISKVINKKTSITKGFAAFGFAYALAIAIDFSSVLYLLNQHALGTSFFWGSKTATNIDSGWANASQTFWLFIQNNYFGRDQILGTLSKHYPLLVGMYEIFGVIMVALSVSSVLFSNRGTAIRRMCLLLIALLLVIVGIYSYSFNGYSVVYDLIPSSNLLLSIIPEGIVPDAAISLIVSILISITSYYLISYYRNYTIQIMESCDTSRIEHKNWNQSATQSPNRTFGNFMVHSRIKILLKTKRGFKDLVPLLLIVCIVIAGFLQASPSYLFGNASFNSGGYTSAPTPTDSMGLTSIMSYMLSHQPGYAVWIPHPYFFGNLGFLYPDSFSYPFLADGSFSTEYFAFMLNGGSQTLLGSRNWPSLAVFEANVGVKYDVIWGPSTDSIASEMISSGYFQVVMKFQSAVLLSNVAFHGLAYASPYAIISSGGLSSYSNFAPYLQEAYPNASPVPFYSDILPFPYQSLNDSRTALLVNNVSDTTTELAVDLAGPSHFYSPLLNVSVYNQAKQWSGGDTTDGGGFGWTNLEANTYPSYSWQSSYTLGDGFIDTFSTTAKLNFSFPVNSAGSYEILVRTLHSSLGNLGYNITVGGKTFVVNIPKTSYAYFSWINLGRVSLHKGWNPTALGSFRGGAINLLTAVPIATWKHFQSVAAIQMQYHPQFIIPPTLDVTSSPLTLQLPYAGNYGLLANPSLSKWSAVLSENNNYSVMKYDNGSLELGSFRNRVQVPDFSNSGRIVLSSSIPTYHSVTVSAWINWSGAEETHAHGIIGQWGPNGPYNFVLAEQNGSILWTLGGSNTGWSSLSYSPIIPNKWYFIVGEFGNHTGKLFVDGQLVATEYHNYNFSSSNTTNIGFYNASAKYILNFNGEIGLAALSPHMLNYSTVECLYNGSGSLHEMPNVVGVGLINNPLLLSNNSVKLSVSGLAYRNVSVYSIPIPLLSNDLSSGSELNIDATSGFISAHFVNAGNISIEYPSKSPPFVLTRNVISPFCAPAIQLNVTTQSEPFDGQVVRSIALKEPQSDMGKPIYVSIAGFGTELILQGSSLSIGTGRFAPFPASGVTEGFVLPGFTNVSTSVGFVSWYNQAAFFKGEVISYTAFFSSH